MTIEFIRTLQKFPLTSRLLPCQQFGSVNRLLAFQKLRVWSKAA